MPDDTFSAMRQSIIDGAPDTASNLAQQAVASRVAPNRGLAAMDGTTPGILERARQRVEELLSGYERHPLPPEREKEMIAFAQREGKKAGLEGLPGIRASEHAREAGLTQ
jgi:hypothetical protein